MATSEGTVGFGVTITGGTTGAIAQVTSTSVNGITTTAVEITNLDSTSGFAEYIAGKSDAGSIELEMVYKKAQETAWATLFEAGSAQAVQEWTIVFPDAGTSTHVVSGILTSHGVAVPEGDSAMTTTATLKCTGVPAFTAGA